jgi:hypothetical protein
MANLFNILNKISISSVKLSMQPSSEGIHFNMWKLLVNVTLILVYFSFTGMINCVYFHDFACLCDCMYLSARSNWRTSVVFYFTEITDN